LIFLEINYQILLIRVLNHFSKMKMTKSERRGRIHKRIRKTITGTAARPRFSVFRSNQGIYCQLIDDLQGHTLASASSKDAGATGSKTEIAAAVGKLIAERAKEVNVASVVFDRGGYLYHGRVKALADGAREGGLQF
jgi:large subunit ribosomal protein L18